MGDIYSYPVYFEGGRLSQEQKRRITNYFRAKCNSDGECSPVEEVSENIYKIAFRHREVQQSVLQRREHIVQLGEESLTLTVNESLDPQTSGHTSTSASTSTSATHPVQVFTSAQEEIHQNQDQGQDQQAVLQRSEHIVQLREDSLMLTVKEKPSPDSLLEKIGSCIYKYLIDLTGISTGVWMGVWSAIKDLFSELTKAAKLISEAEVFVKVFERVMAVLGLGITGAAAAAAAEAATQIDVPGL
ncbi:uncharacterized protein LOC115408482 isoform X2 [Salarias fasciatus]|uniref:uncharacterized protein LOC115408482 isoform X2 n=1 Tax=Salarias fasciatus TaxID=181472 RepID=UPI0011770658|nr:uncharacterized protein LOC115408482 isoform X2 [Salarias fasciatus]